MHHMVAYEASQTTATPTDTEINAVADGIMAIQNNHIVPQRNTAVLFGLAAGTTIIQAYLRSPKLTIPTVPFIIPLIAGAVMPNPPHVADWLDAPLALNGLEEIQVFTQHTAATAELNYAVLALDQGQQPAPPGDVRTLHGTAAGTMVANSWTNVGTITWQNTLPGGLYAVVGGWFQSATCLAGRLILENQYFRPGCLGSTAVTDATYRKFRFGGLGLWGTFHNTFMPQAEFFCTAADAAEKIALDVVKIG